MSVDEDASGRINSPHTFLCTGLACVPWLVHKKATSPPATRVKWGWNEGGSYGRSAELSKDVGRLEAQLHAASGRSSKIIKDAEGIETVVAVPGRGTLTLRVQSGGGYSLRVHPEREDRSDEAADRDLVALGVLDAEEVVSVVPG
jgi:hypothetical protein